MEDKEFIRFEAYLSGALNAAEIVDFEAELISNSNFNTSFTTYKELSSFLDHQTRNKEALNAFKNNVSQISKVHFIKSSKNSKVKIKGSMPQFYKYAIAACAVLLLGVFAFNQFSNPSYSDYSNYETISLTVRGSGNVLLKTAEDAFNTKDFRTAEKAFTNLLLQDKDHAEYKLYKAISHVELNEFSVADAAFETLMGGHSAFKNSATWYLALSKLKQEHLKACLSVLKTIPEDSEHYNQALIIINKLD